MNPTTINGWSVKDEPKSFVQAKDAKIDEIKHIREYTKERYGESASLITCKTLIDSVIENQAFAAKEVEKKKAAQFLNTLTHSELRQMLRDMGFNGTQHLILR